MKFYIKQYKQNLFSHKTKILLFGENLLHEHFLWNVINIKHTPRKVKFRINYLWKQKYPLAQLFPQMLTKVSTFPPAEKKYYKIHTESLKYYPSLHRLFGYIALLLLFAWFHLIEIPIPSNPEVCKEHQNKFLQLHILLLVLLWFAKT